MGTLNGEILVHRSRRPNRPGKIFFVTSGDLTGRHTISLSVAEENQKPSRSSRATRFPIFATREKVSVVMAHRLMSLGGIARRTVNRAVVQAFARPYAANVATVSEEDLFLKWTTPEPQQFIHQGILAAPETKVRVRPRRPSLARLRRANRLPPPRRSRSRARSPLNGQKPLPRWRARPSGFCPLSPERLPPARPSNPVR